MIRENSQRMGHLIDDLLTFSRLSRASISSTSIDMQGLVFSVYQELSAIKTLDHIQFTVNSLHTAPGDRSMLRQVWFNLIDNAVKFTSRKQHPVITVSSTIKDNMVVYSVTDNGAGFDMKYSDKLFGVFQRLHNAREFEGTGVGLAIIQRIIYKHGGNVGGTGTIGEGATFFFTLPAGESSNQ